MGDTKTEILDAAKLLLGITDEENDELLTLLIDDTISAVLSYCRIEVLPRQLVSLIPLIAAGRYRLNGRSDVKSVTEGERRVEYTGNGSFLDEYAARLKPFVSRSVKLPSDIIVKEENDDQSIQ